MKVRGMPEPVLRDYRDSDYEFCEALVNEAWKFDSNFNPQELADLAKFIYTMGSVIGSNFRKVVESDGKVVGFIFGLNTKSNKPKGRVLFGLKVLWRLWRIKELAKEERNRLG